MQSCRLAGLTALVAIGAFPLGADGHPRITTTVLFNREVAAVIAAKCAQCHVKDGMAMPLQRYDQARPWAESIKQEVLARRMPPWPAERDYGTFANDQGLTPREEQFLLSWIDGGVPEGEGTPPAAMDHSGHWMLGSPDREIALTRLADGAPKGYQRYIVDPGLEQSAAVRALDLKIDDKQVRAAFISMAGTGQYIGGWTRSNSSVEFPAPAALRLEPGAKLVVDILQASGTAPTVEVPTPRLGIYFAADRHEWVQDFEIRGIDHANPKRLRAEQILDSTQAVLGFRVDMSEGGESVELNARTPDGTFIPLVLIRKFNADWPTPFVLATPVVLPKGSVLRVTGHFDTQRSTHAEVGVKLVLAGEGVTPSPQIPHQHMHVQ